MSTAREHGEKIYTLVIPIFNPTPGVRGGGGGGGGWGGGERGGGLFWNYCNP